MNDKIDKAKLVECLRKEIDFNTRMHPNILIDIIFKKINSGEFDGEAFKSELILTDAEIDSACLSWRHDFGLMSNGEKYGLRCTAKEWLRGLNQAKELR